METTTIDTIIEREQDSRIETAASELAGATEHAAHVTGEGVGHWTLITPYFWPQVGGVQQYVAMMCRALGPTSVTVIAPKLRATHDLEPADETIGQITIHRPFADRLRLLHTAVTAFRETRGRTGGIVIGVPRPTALSAIALKRLFGVPYVVCCHGKELVTESSYRRWANRMLLSRADRVIANSAFTAELAVRSGADQSTIEVLRPALSTPVNGTDASDRCDALRDDYGLHDRRILLTVGRLVARKGHELVLRSLRSLIDADERLLYVIVGDGPERARLERLADDLGLRDAVLFAGRVSDEDTAAWYRLADIFVMVSRSDDRDIEGFGIVYLEAAAAGKPVIAGRGGGVSDAVLDGVSGILVDPTSQSALLAALRRLLDDPVAARAMGEAGQQWVSTQLREPEFANRLRQILSSVLHVRGARVDNGTGKTMTSLIKRLPFGRKLARPTARKPFRGSSEYWRHRYADGRTSGVGSYGAFAEFKAQVLNAFVREHGVRSVIEFGCGDGNQLGLAEYPSYLGLDISRDAIALCRARFAHDDTKAFKHLDEYAGETAALALSLDVVYHLIEDDVYGSHLSTLFDSSERFVIVYSSNTDEQEDNQAPHVRHRRFTDWVEANRPGWTLIEHIPNRYPYRGDHTTGSFADFYIFQRRDDDEPGTLARRSSADQ